MKCNFQAYYPFLIRMPEHAYRRNNDSQFAFRLYFYSANTRIFDGDLGTVYEIF